MKIGILGTGMVGEALAGKLVKNGHEVKMGSRQAGNEKAKAWAAGAGRLASEGSFADAAAFGEIVFNCTSGGHSLEALQAAGAANLRAKVLVDVANPLDFSKGMPPTLSVCNNDSLGEQIQRAFPEAKVVKALNTLNAYLMVDPSSLGGEHDLFIAGNDAWAKAKVTELLVEEFGWKAGAIRDCGDISAARGTEGILLLWIRLFGGFGHPNFNFHLNVGPAPQG
jgi:predicted dinucleotide-binding enzyme